MAGNDFLNYCTYCGDRSICSVEFIDPQEADMLLEEGVSAWCKQCGIDGDDLLKVSHHLKYNKVMAQLKYEGKLFEEYHKYPTDYTPPEKFTDLYFKRIKEMGY